jgi:hypothetical protein
MSRMPLALACLLLAGAAHAADGDLREFSTDRPNKSSSATTVDAGHWQVESDLFNWSRDRDRGDSTRTLSTVLPTLKLGLTDRTDLELTLPTYVWTRSSSSGVTHRAMGWSDLVLTGKVNLIGNDEGDLAIGVAPYVKLPTGSDGISNKRTEFGVYAPATFKLDEDWSISFQVQLDALASDTNPDARRFNAQSFVNVSYALTDTLVLSAEHYAGHKFRDGSATVQTFDLAIAWVAQPDLQFDAGVYLPLNKAATDLVVYWGVSRRF